MLRGMNWQFRKNRWVPHFFWPGRVYLVSAQGVLQVLLVGVVPLYVNTSMTDGVKFPLRTRAAIFGNELLAIVAAYATFKPHEVVEVELRWRAPGVKRRFINDTKILGSIVIDCRRPWVARVAGQSIKSIGQRVCFRDVTLLKVINGLIQHLWRSLEMVRLHFSL